MNQDRPLLGIALMTGFTLTAPLMDAFAKLSSAEIPVGQIVATRFAIQAMILLPIAWALSDLSRPSLRDMGLHLLRAALILTATMAFFGALQFMPIADAIAIFFVEPFILTLLGALFLGEQIGWRRLAACAVGFAGALLIIRPSFSVFGPVALLPLLTALCFALYMVTTRQIARRLSAVALQSWTALAACILVAPLLALGTLGGADFLTPVMPQGRFWLFLLAVGLIASASHLMISAALGFAPAATLAPLQYLEIVTATLFGYLIFNDLPDSQTFAGIALIAASGFYVFLRERRLERESLPAPPPPA
ncbi:DMT family transporter [Oceaniglobus indicus]|uniref:DMT family transporter n=1 Tax=Oceaniglobus indicus TaxID=2047749 RepID=UPI000C1A6FA8|nr:DMT family transporter [Oceaniglobus indicus]